MPLIVLALAIASACAMQISREKKYSLQVFLVESDKAFSFTAITHDTTRPPHIKHITLDLDLVILISL